MRGKIKKLCRAAESSDPTITGSNRFKPKMKKYINTKYVKLCKGRLTGE